MDLLAGVAQPPTREQINSAPKEQVLEWQKEYRTDWKVSMLCSARIRQLDSKRGSSIAEALAVASAGGNSDYSR